MMLPKLFWKKIEGGRMVSFDNAPFSVDKEALLDCQYGKQYWKVKEQKKSKLEVQTTRKFGCLAHIKIKSYTVYSDFKLDESSISSSKLRSFKEDTLKKLKEALLYGKANGELHHFVSLPTEGAHCGHPIGATAGFSQRVHPIVIAQN